MGLSRCWALESLHGPPPLHWWLVFHQIVVLLALPLAEASADQQVSPTSQNGALGPRGRPPRHPDRPQFARVEELRPRPPATARWVQSPMEEGHQEQRVGRDADFLLGPRHKPTQEPPGVLDHGGLVHTPFATAKGGPTVPPHWVANSCGILAARRFGWQDIILEIDAWKLLGQGVPIPPGVVDAGIHTLERLSAELVSQDCDA
mmetsp:Transcript_99598/g.277275  ORF Transcript_99598/g.277275 Transcript_99598/m.277275 type:complete len:204 (-) Transcript_99598:528-1139(-)